MSNINPHSLPSRSACVALRGFRVFTTHSPIDWTILFYREAWPWACGTLEVCRRGTKILRELGMRQATYAHLKRPRVATFTTGMEDDILQFIPSTWHGKLVSVLSIFLTCPSFGTRYYAGQSITDLGETGKSWEWVWVVGKVQDRERAQKAKRLPQSAVKCLLKGTQKQMWFDIGARAPLEKIDP